MDQRLFRIATKVATPTSLASLSVIALYLIYQSVVGLQIFGDLTGDQTSQLINNIANKIFYLAVLLSVLGISSYLYSRPSMGAGRGGGDACRVRRLGRKPLYCQGASHRSATFGRIGAGVGRDRRSGSSLVWRSATGEDGRGGRAQSGAINGSLGT